MSEEVIYVYKFDKESESEADERVKITLGLKSIYTEESSRTMPSYINRLKTDSYLKFKTTEKKYDPQSDSMKDKQVFYYILTIPLNGKEIITKDIPQLIQHIIEFYKREIKNIFKGQTAFEDVYRDYKNKHPKKDMLDYSSAKRDFFEKSSMYGKQHPENVYTPYQSFLDTLVLYLIYILQDKYKSAFKKLKHKKSKSIRKFSKIKSKIKSKVKSKVLYEIKSKFFTHPPDFESDQKHEDIIKKTYKHYEDWFDIYFSRIVNIKKDTLDRFSKNSPSTLISMISPFIDNKKYDNILKTVIAHMTAYRECKDNDNFVLYLLNLFKLFNDYFDRKDIDFQTLILFNVITTKIITDKTYREKCPLDSKILKELKDKEQSIKDQVDEFLKTSNVTDLDLLLEESKPKSKSKSILKVVSVLDDVKSLANPDASNVSESKKKHKHNPDGSLALADLNLFLKDYQSYKSGNHDYDAFFAKLKSENLFKEGIVNLFKQKFVGFVSEITRYSSKDIFEIIKIVINLIFNKKPEPEYNPFKRIYSFLFDVKQLKRIQAFLDDLNTVMPNFDKIMIKDRDKNPFFLMYFLCNQGIYVELYCNGKVYKINNCSPEKESSNPYKIHVSECYSTPLILQKFGIVQDGLRQTTETPGGRTRVATPGGNISHAASSATGSSQGKTLAHDETSYHKDSTMGGFTIGLAEEKDIFSQCKNLSQSYITNLLPLDAVLYHQCKRFYELDLILSQRPQTTVVIAGDSETGHSLGKGIAIGAWGGKDNQDYKKMQANLTKYITYLVTKYGKVRITFGNVGQKSKNKKDGEKGSEFNVTREPEESYINVWGADVDNWNLVKNNVIEGDGQASSFERQAPGVFGICTMPVNSKTKEKVLEESKYTTILPGSDRVLSPSPQIKKGDQTPARAFVQGNTPPASPFLRPQEESSDDWDTSEDDKSLSGYNSSSGQDSDESISDEEHDEKHEKVVSNPAPAKHDEEEVVFNPSAKTYYVYFGSLDDKTANKSDSIVVDKKNIQDYINHMQPKDELKEYIKSKLKESQILIRFYRGEILTKFIYLTTEKNEKLQSILVTSAHKDTSLQSVFEIVPHFKFKNKSLLKKPVSKKKSIAKKSVSKKKSLVKKSVSKKKSLVKKSVSKKKSLAKKSVSKKKSLAKKPVKSLYKKKKF